MPSAAEIILEYVCPVLGVVAANLMWLAPVKDLRSAVRQGAGLGDLNPTPWAFMLGNCVGWSSYGVLASNWFVFWGNYPGFLIACWLNLGAVKLLYASHHTDETRRSLIDFLSSSSPLATENGKDHNKGDKLVHHSLSGENGDRDPIETTTAVGYGDGNADPSHSSRSTENSPDDAADPALANISSKKQHLHHETNDWAKIVWEVTSQTTIAKAPHDRLVLVIVIAWSLVLAGIGFFAGNSNGSSSGGNRLGQFIVGYVVNLNLVFFYGAPLSAIGKVLRSKRSDALHVPTMMMNTNCATFWTVYAIAINDPFMYVPNGLGVVLGAIQLVLWVVFPKSTSTEGNSKPSEGPIPEKRERNDTHKDDTNPKRTIESTVMVASV